MALVRGDLNPGDVAEFGAVGGGGDRSAVTVGNLHPHHSFIGQQRAAPATGAEGRNRGQRQQARAQRYDRAVGRQVIGGRPRRGCNQQAVANQFVEPLDAVDLNPDPGSLPGLAQQGDFVEGLRPEAPAGLVLPDHVDRPDLDPAGLLEALVQAVFLVVIHQEADRTPVHAVNRCHRAELAHDFEHMSVPTQRHDHVRLAWVDVGVA